jgi:hypothetical protein
MALTTGSAYWFWIRRFIFFYNKRHPRDISPAEVKAFLSHLAEHQPVAAATRKQALNALVFLYREILHQELGDPGHFARPTRPARTMPMMLPCSSTRAPPKLPGCTGTLIRKYRASAANSCA